MTRRTAAAVMIGLVAWCGTMLLQAGQLVPYKGTIEGAVFIADNQIQAPPARMISSHLGKGTQVYQELAIGPDPEATFLRAAGVSRSIAANGDELWIDFVLEGPLNGNEPVRYVGTYTVRPDGTGRFAYDPTIRDLGHGELAGVALITVDDGVTTILFRHDFVGTLYLQPRRNRGVSQ